MNKQDKQLYAESNAEEYNRNPEGFIRQSEMFWSKILKENPKAKKENYIYKGNILGFKRRD